MSKEKRVWSGLLKFQNLIAFYYLTFTLYLVSKKLCKRLLGCAKNRWVAFLDQSTICIFVVKCCNSPSKKGCLKNDAKKSQEYSYCTTSNHTKRLMANTIFTVYLRKIVKILIPKIWHVFLNDFTRAASEEFSTSFASSRFPAFPVIFKSSFSIKKISCLYLQKVIASCLSMKCSREGFLFQQIVLILITSNILLIFKSLAYPVNAFQ